MNSNSTESASVIEQDAELRALADAFWDSHIVALSQRLHERGVLPLGPAAPASTWRSLQAGAAESSAFTAQPASAAEVFARLWANEPQLLALLEPLQQLSERVAALQPEEDAELSSQLYVMF
jgi:hypothetical protein